MFETKNLDGTQFEPEIHYIVKNSSEALLKRSAPQAKRS
jgi:hypothetical protein